MTNRQRLARVRRDMATVRRDIEVGPAPYSLLQKAEEAVREAMNYALDEGESDAD